MVQNTEIAEFKIICSLKYLQILESDDSMIPTTMDYTCELYPLKNNSKWDNIMIVFFSTPFFFVDSITNVAHIKSSEVLMSTSFFYLSIQQNKCGGDYVLSMLRKWNQSHWNKWRPMIPPSL